MNKYKTGDRYYFVSSFGGSMHVEESTWMGYERDKLRQKQGNMFRTKLSAEGALKRVRLALKNNK